MCYVAICDSTNVLIQIFKLINSANSELSVEPHLSEEGDGAEIQTRKRNPQRAFIVGSNHSSRNGFLGSLESIEVE
jgi:hypothetical protein